MVADRDKVWSVDRTWSDGAQLLNVAQLLKNVLRRMDMGPQRQLLRGAIDDVDAVGLWLNEEG